MKITIRFWKLRNYLPDYSKRIEMVFTGKTAASCMNSVREYKVRHDLSVYTTAEIINVQDD